MTQREKIEILKDAIYNLYEKEGRSINYISNLLSVDRKVLTDCIKNEWGFIKADVKHMIPSKEKFLNKNRQHIIDMLYNDDILYQEMADSLNITRGVFQKYLLNDKELNHYRILRNQRHEERTHNRIESLKDKSSFIYDYEEFEDEEWKDILGYEDYQVSNYGRVRSYSVRYKSYYLLKENINSRSGRVYIHLYKNGERRNISLPRLVGFAFVDGHSEENNTINHIDMNIRNNKSSNLEWVSQADNNRKMIASGKYEKPIAYSKISKFKKIVVDDKYEFKTIVSLAKFLNVSETQARRYLLKETKCDRKIVIVY